jgi:enoyl-CoA hydratase
MEGQVSEGTEVVIEKHGHVLIIRLNRPHVRNAMNAALARGLNSAIDRLDDDHEVRVGLLVGAAAGFCSGMDLKALLRGESPFTERGWGGIARMPPRKPLIAAIEGFALAGGMELALSCDLIVAARGAKLGLPEVTRGLVATAGGLIRLARRIPYHSAMYIGLTGAPISAERAYEIGLVNELCEPGAAYEKGLELARVIASNAPLAVEASKEIVHAALDLNEADGWELQDRVGMPVVSDSADAKEGALAFMEKRAPIWRGI